MCFFNGCNFFFLKGMAVINVFANTKYPWVYISDDAFQKSFVKQDWSVHLRLASLLLSDLRLASPNLCSDLKISGTIN